MLHPSYREMIDKINERRQGDEPVITSRYELITAVSKRARQITDENISNMNKGKKNLSAAVMELYKGEVNIIRDTGEESVTEEEQTKSVTERIDVVADGTHVKKNIMAEEYELRFPVSVNGGDRTVEVSLETDDYDRFCEVYTSITDEIETGEADEIESYEELREIYGKIREQVVQVLAEDLQAEPGAYEDLFLEEEIDIDDINSVANYVSRELEFYIGWPIV